MDELGPSSPCLNICSLDDRGVCRGCFRTLAGVAFGQTVLSRATEAAGLEWNTGEAHSAAYDAERTADLFCIVCNQFQPLFEAAARRLAGTETKEPPNPLLEPEPE